MWSADYICPIFYLNKLNDFVMYDKQFITSFTYEVKWTIWAGTLIMWI